MAGCPVFVPVHCSRSHSRLLFSLVSLLDSALPQPLLSPQAVSGEGSREKKDGMALAQGLGEAREEPSHPSFLPFKTGFAP